MDSLLNAAPAPGFDEPLEMLLACHERIQAQCETLRKLVEYLPLHGNDAQTAQAAQAILRYFDSAGRHHHEDEERDLFPHMLASDNGAARALIARLQEEHLDMDAAWQLLRQPLLNIAAARTNQLDKRIAMKFIDIHNRHIATENAELLPLAGKLLNARHLRAMGHSMAVRRGVAL